MGTEELLQGTQSWHLSHRDNPSKSRAQKVAYKSVKRSTRRPSPASVAMPCGFCWHDSIGWRPNAGDEQHYAPIDVPAGFVTDLASIPWYLWSWLPNDGPYMHAAIIHDWIYWDQSRSREEADNILWIDMTDLGVGYLTRQMSYQAVSRFGQGAWDSNAKLKASGEKRLLKKYPSDPTTTWDEWKKQPDVFA